MFYISTALTVFFRSMSHQYSRHDQPFAYKYVVGDDFGEGLVIVVRTCRECTLVSLAMCPAVESLTQWRNICSDVTSGQSRSQVTGRAVGMLADTLWQDLSTDSTEKV